MSAGLWTLYILRWQQHHHHEDGSRKLNRVKRIQVRSRRPQKDDGLSSKQIEHLQATFIKDVGLVSAKSLMILQNSQTKMIRIDYI